MARAKAKRPKRAKRSELAELLEAFHEAAQRDDLVAVVDDPSAIRLLAAWPRARTEWKRPRRARPTGADALWVWLWDGCWYDLEELALASKLTEPAAEQYLHTCASARVAFPDGSISTHARELIAEHVRNRWPGRRQGRPPGVRAEQPRANPKGDDDE